MGVSEIIKRLFLLVMFWPLLFGVAEAAGAGFELKGVLISPTTRSALINGQILREGELVDNAEVLAIEEDSVRLLVGSDEYDLFVGSATLVHQPRSHRTQQDAYTVRSGDTLSNIAERYAGNGLTINQVMMALYETNPEAFDGNINRVRAGATLVIPDRSMISGVSHPVATARVTQQTKRWRPPSYPVTTKPAPAEEPAPAETYGPVVSGDTLSAIAARSLRDGVTLNQMMIAVFEANPGAFAGNINLLRKGAVLEIPDANQLRQVTHESATAEVLRQTEAWQSRFAALPPKADESMLASVDVLGLISHLIRP